MRPRLYATQQERQSLQHFGKAGTAPTLQARGRVLQQLVDVGIGGLRARMDEHLTP